MRNINILLVDDHQIMLDGIQAFLKDMEGLEIVGAMLRGEEALKFLADGLIQVDVAILDIFLVNGISGLETARRIRKDYPNIKIIMLTVDADGSTILQAMKLGVQSYVLKEKSKEVLVSAIHAVYDGNMYWSPDLIDKIAKAQQLPEVREEPLLTPRELETICMMARYPSLTNKELADKMDVEKTTVDTHIRNAKKKLNLHRSMELVVYVTERRLCP